MPLHLAPLDQMLSVPYMDLTGGLNTKRDPHALDRNQLALSVNAWYATGTALSKRPGNAPFCNGETGSGLPGGAMAVVRFGEITYVLVQQGANVYAATSGSTAWEYIGQVSAQGTIAATNLYDPDGADINPAGSDAAFICDGQGVPQRWNPGTPLTPVRAGAGNSDYLPYNYSGTAPITPKYVATLESHLFYAGEPTAPTAVYISDAFFPERFTASIYAASPYNGNTGYLPLLVGHNDGIEGGNITGLRPLANAMIVYKESAVYALSNVSLVGDMVFAPTQLSVSVGCLSPRSIAEFDTFHCFLGIDGVYQIGLEGARRISDNVSSFFDGPSAAIVDRTTAVGVRIGQRYLIFFDDGGAKAALTPMGYPTTGIWFDFSRTDADGFPTCGQIMGMAVNGVAELRGPHDTGTFVWCDGSQDRIGEFGRGHADFDAPIAVTVQGKSDFFSDVYQYPDMPVRFKNVNRIWLCIALTGPYVADPLTFTVTAALDRFAQQMTSGGYTDTIAYAFGAIVGQAVVGTDVIGGDPFSTFYQVVEVWPQDPAQGHVVGIGVSETSTVGWTLLGYIAEVNAQEIAA